MDDGIAPDQPARDQMSGRRALVLVNRRSANGRADITEAFALLREAGLTLDIRACDSPGDLPRIARESAAAHDLVIAAGGDGTLNGLADAMIESGRPLAILPTGTANDLARTLAIPADPRRAAAVIVEGCRLAIDVGRVNGKPFFNVASIGASVDVARTMQKRRDRNTRLGVLAYPLALWEARRETKRFRVTLRVDALEERFHAVQLAIGNGRHYGGGMVVAEDAEVHDGALDVYALKARPMWRILMHLPSLRRGRHHVWDGVIHLKGRRVAVDTPRPMDVNTDGELTTRTPAVFQVVPRALEVYVPAATLEARRKGEGSAMSDDGASTWRSDAEIALDDVTIGCKRTAAHLADSADLAEDPDVAALFRGLSARRADWGAEMERRMLEMDLDPGAPDDDGETVRQMARHLKAAFTNAEHRDLLDDCLTESEDLATTVSKALQTDDVSEAARDTLADLERALSDDIATLRDTRDRWDRG